MVIKRIRGFYSLLFTIIVIAAAGVLFASCGSTSGAAGNRPAGPDASGSGTRRDPFIVASEASLRKVGSGLDGWTLNAWYRQVANIEMSSGNWKRIGFIADNADPGGAFSGVYDGGGFTVSGLDYTVDVVLYDNTDDTEGHGMFGAVASPGEVKNLTLIGNVAVNIIPGVEEGIGRVVGVGGVVGWLAGGAVENVTFKGSVRVGDGRTFTDPLGNALSTDYYGHRTGINVGGVVGGVTTAVSRVANCHSEAIVIGYFQVGGVIGSLENMKQDANRSFISDNSFTPPETGIDGTSFVIMGTNRVGLVIGNMGDFTTSQRLTSTGNVKQHILAGSYPNHEARNIGGVAGGVIGRSNGRYFP